MAGFSEYLGNKILDHVNGVASYTPPSTLYVALFSDSATLEELDAGTITNEVTGDGYARQEVTFGTADASAAENDASVTFTATGSNWDIARFAAVMDAETGGNVLYYGQLSNDRELAASGDSIEIQTGDFDVSLDA